MKLRRLALRKLSIPCRFRSAHDKISNNWRRGSNISSYTLISVFCKQQSIHHPLFNITLQSHYDLEQKPLQVNYFCQVPIEHLEGND